MQYENCIFGVARSLDAVVQDGCVANVKLFAVRVGGHKYKHIGKYRYCVAAVIVLDHVLVHVFVQNGSS